MPQNYKWYNKAYAPGFSPEWIRVTDLRDYLINNGLASGHWKSLPIYPTGYTARGCIVQFCTPAGVWNHSAVIVNVKSGTFFYSQHTDDANHRRYTGNWTNFRTFRIY